MRAALLFVVVALASVALADEPKSSVASRPLGAEGITSDPPRAPTSWQGPATEASAVVYGDQTTVETTTTDAAPAEEQEPHEPPKKITISITGSQFIFDHAPGTPGCMIAPGHKATIICDTVTFTSVPGEWPKLQCKVCEVTLPSGATGTAAEVVYDAATKKLSLIGSEEEPIRLVSNSRGQIETITAAKMDIELKFSQPASFPIPTPATYIEIGDRYAPATTISPNPIHRLDKALITE